MQSSAEKTLAWDLPKPTKNLVSTPLFFPNFISQPSKRTVFLIAAVLFFVSLLIRLPGISRDTLQPDERHWVIRSQETLYKLKTGDSAHFTSHLGHPGVPPALVMSFGQALRKLINPPGEIESLEQGAVDRLTASRVANAVFSCLLFPLMLILLSELVEFEIALLAVLLFVVSPTHIGYSRMAHIDSLLTLFVTTSMLLYALAEKKMVISYKIFSGIFWGLAIATKPTAGFLIPGLLAYRFGRKIIFKDSRPVICWSDFWAILIGHLVFALSYSRLWEVESRYVYKFSINNPITKFLTLEASTLQGNALLFGGVLLCICLSSVYLYKHRASSARWRYHFGMAAFAFSILLLAVTQFPIVIANIIRFWMWSSGLVHVNHKTYGILWSPPRFGYLGLLFSKLPGFVLLGSLLSIFSISKLFTLEKEENRKTASFYLLCLVVPFFWIAFLSTSSKQTFRYLMPVVPCIYLLGAVGLVTTLAGITKRFSFLKKHSVVIYCSFLIILVSTQTAFSLSWKPHFNLYSNSLSGDLEAEVASGRPLPVAGISEAIRVLQNDATLRNREDWVSVLGDIDVLTYSYKREYPTDSKRLRFAPFNNFVSGDFLIVFPSFQHRLKEIIGEGFEDLSLVYHYPFRGVTLLSVYELPFPDYKTPHEFNIRRMPRNTGRQTPLEKGVHHGIVMNPTQDRPGHIFFGTNVRIKAGDYRLTFPFQIEEAKAFQPNNKVLQLELGRCIKVFTEEELRKANGSITLPCHFTMDRNRQLRGFWFGKLGIFLGDAVLSAKPKKP